MEAAQDKQTFPKAHLQLLQEKGSVLPMDVNYPAPPPPFAPTQQNPQPHHLFTPMHTPHTPCPPEPAP